MGFTTLKWPGQEASYFAALHSGRGSTKRQARYCISGKENVSTEEKAQYDEGVDVYFQSCAWMDSDINMQWVTKTLAPGIGNSPEEKVIFADNVTFQQDKKFHDTCGHELNTIVYLLPENHTDKIQPIDAGFGKTLKTKIGQEMDKWLEEKDNLEL